jgi:hypothetical protein
MVVGGTETVPCDCGKQAKLVFLPRRKQRNFDPIVVFRDPETGKYSYPGRSDEPTPSGYERVELHNIPEVRRFEAEINCEQQRQHEIRGIREELTFEPGRRERRAQLYKEMASMSNRGRDFARVAIEHANQERKPKYDPGFRVEVLS